jgi:hypothetical protein
MRMYKFNKAIRGPAICRYAKSAQRLRNPRRTRHGASGQVVLTVAYRNGKSFGATGSPAMGRTATELIHSLMKAGRNVVLGSR